MKELKSQVNDVLPWEYWTWESDGEIIDIIKDLLEGSNDDQEEILKLKEENEKLKEENETFSKHIAEQEIEIQELRVKNTSIHTLESCNHQQKLRIEELEEENDVLQKFIAGNLDCVAEVKTLISRDWTKEFIANNQERWEEVGLEFDEEDFE